MNDSLETLPPKNLTPLEVVTDIIPDDRWNDELRYDPTDPDPMHPSQFMIEAGFQYIAPAFGERVVDDKVQACSLEDLVTVHQAIANILGDEHSHTALLTVAPYPYADRSRSNEALANDDAWLIAIRDGHWPLPGSYRRLGLYSPEQPATYSTELSRDKHDTGDKHIVFMLYAPREMQDQITEAAEYGMSERLEALDSPHDHKGLVLDGERHGEEDPLDYSWRGEARYGGANAMKVIDDISDDPSFGPVMKDLLALDGAEARRAYVQHYRELAEMSREDRNAFMRQAEADALGSGPHHWTEAVEWRTAETARIDHLVMQMRSIVAITNFNMRHREGRNMTETEQAQAKQAYLAGLVRVADKFSGDYLLQAA